MKLKTYALLAAAAACGLASAAETAYTTPVGYTTIPIPGTGGSGTQKIQIANQGLLPSDAVQYAGVAETITATYVEDVEGTWTAGSYVTQGANGPIVTHLVEITSGPLQGTMTWITSSTASPNRLFTSDDISAAGNGSSFRVLKAFTVATLFGNPPSPSVALGTGLISTSDNIQVYNPVGASTTYWYKGAGGNQGWKSTDASIPGAEVPLTAIHPNDGLIFFRKQASDGALVIAGSVKPTNTKIRVEGNGTGPVYNVIATQHPVEGVALTIGNSGLWTGDPNTGLKGTGLISTSDTVQIWDPATSSYTTFWYKGAGGNQGWKVTGTGTLPPVPADYQIPSNTAVVIVRNAGNPFTWDLQSAYNPSL